MISVGYCNIGYPSETHLKLKSREISFVYNLLQRLNCFEILHRARQWYCRALAKFQNDWRTETDVIDTRDFARFEFKMNFRRVSFILLSGTHFTLDSWAHTWNIVKNDRFNYDPNDTIVAPICTYHDRPASVACTKLCPDCMSIFQVRVIWIFARFRLWTHKPLWNRSLLSGPLRQC